MVEEIRCKNIHGSIVWFLGRHIHRVDGPAVTRPDGKLIWFHFNKIHREDGPAVINPDGSTEWYLNGELIEFKSVEDWQDKVKIYHIGKVMSV